ncbi:MAG: hypothetical protein KDD82_03585, partial [Planctomycetes bacterium]|nr:hypothetical protein [Planctomycetota bacterium]
GRGELDFADADPPLVVPNLTRLSLDGAGSVEVDPGEALTEVALSGAEQACRELVERFAGRGLPLTRLDLRAFREFDLGEAAWARLPALRELRVETGVFGCPVEAELAHLERLDLDVMLARDLEPLLARTSATLRHLRYTGALGALDALAPLSQLRSLVLGRSARPSPRVLAELECWGRLERLGFSGNLQVGWAEAVVAARSLRELNLDAADRWPAEAYQALQRLPALETLSLRGEPGTGSAWLPLLAGLPLRALHYRGGAEPDFDAFPALPALRRLNLEVAGAEWSAEQLLRLLEPGELEELELGGALVPAAVLEALPELQPRLRVLRVHGEQVSDTTLSALGRLRELRELDLLGVEPQDVSQAGWKRLLEAPVERLRLGIEPPSTSWRQALRFTLHALRGNLDLGW